MIQQNLPTSDRSDGRISRSNFWQPGSHYRCCYGDSHTCRSNVGLLVLFMELKLKNPARSPPTVDFHMNTQSPADGTFEGMIMFDLKKNATPLYVLGFHKQQISACRFSPDGRRLITVSLEENLAPVWKVSSIPSHPLGKVMQIESHFKLLHSTQATQARTYPAAIRICSPSTTTRQRIRKREERLFHGYPTLIGLILII